MASRTSSRSSMFRQIRNICSEIQPRCPYSQVSRPQRTAPHVSPTLDLEVIFPSPCSLALELEASGMNAKFANHFSTCYVMAATRLKGRCESLLRKRYQHPDIQCSSNVLHLLEQTISRQYKSTLRQWKETVLQMTYSSTSLPTGKNRPTFKQDCVPLLERYWVYNAYPSPADRAVLADKTGLTHRQIEVWFQNHRNRAKKMGRPRARLNSDYGSFPWDDFEEAPQNKHLREDSPGVTNAYMSPSSPRPESSRFSSNSPSRSNQATRPLQIALCNNILEVVHPPTHAFPTAFSLSEPPPSNPRQITAPCQFEWYRRPASKVTTRQTPTMDDLCDSFKSCLNLRRQNRQNPADEASQHWFPATYVALHPTHHPALLKQNPGELYCSDGTPSLQLSPFYYSPPPNSQVDGFLRYLQQPSSLTEAIAAKQKCFNPNQLRRRSSTSSVDSSVECSTPVSSPSAPFIHLQTDEHELPYIEPVVENLRGDKSHLCDLALFLQPYP